MSLVDLIRRHNNVKAVDTTPNDLQEIHSWLFKIGEPESLHHICLNKCRANREDLEYFLKHARGELHSETTLPADPLPIVSGG